MEPNEKLEVGYGFSKGSESYAVGVEAARQALGGVKNYAPSLVLVFASVRYELEELLRGVHTVVGEVPLVGATTAGEICNGPQHESAVVTILASPYLEVSVGLGERVSQGWRQAVAQAVSAPGLAPFFSPADNTAWSELTLQGKSAFALMFAPGETFTSILHSFEILEELKRLSQDRLPVIGGAAGDDLRMETNYVLWGKQAYPDSLLLVICRTQLRFGIAMAHGLNPTAKRVMVTHACNHEVLELEGQLAAEVYSSLMGYSRESLEGKHLTRVTGRPLGTLDPYGQYSINVAAYFTPNGGLRVAQPVTAGTILTVMAGTPESVAVAGREALRKALLRGSITQAATVLAFSCVIRTGFLGDRLIEETQGMQQILPDVPITGFYSMGEQALADDGVNRNNTVVIAVLVLGRELSYAAQVALERERLRNEVERAEAVKKAFEALKKEVAERQKAEQALRNNERFLANIFDSIQDGLTILDADFNIRRINPTMEAWFPHGRSILGKKCYTAYHGRQSPCEVCPARQSLETGKTAHKLVSTTNSELPGRCIDIYTYPLIDPSSGKISGVIEYAKDITEKVQAEEAVRLAKERLVNLIKASPLPIISCDTDGRLTSWNPAAEQIFGWREEEILGGIPPMVPKDMLDHFYTIYRRQLAGEPDVSGLELPVCQRDGAPREIKLFSSTLQNDAGETIGVVSILEDITELKKAEKALRRSEEQLRQSQKMEAVGRLAGGIAHDFNNILMVISGYAELLLQTLRKEDEAWQDVQEIQRATDRAATLTQQLLAFSRKQVIRLEPLNLNEVVTKMDKMFRRLIREDIELQTCLEPELGAVMADRGQIEQVIINLIVNAQDAMPQGGELTLETANVDLDPEYVQKYAHAKPGPYVRLEVSDTGIGMDREIQEHLFEPFFTTKKQGEGTGLGLSMAYAIVNQGGGFIGVYSETGEGSTLKVYLPRLASTPEPAPAPQVFMPEEAVSETILLAEDEELVRQVTSRILAGSGYTVLEAGSGPEALKISEQHQGPIHLLLTDVLMPEMSGPQLAKALSSLRPETKVIFMSGHTENTIVHHGVLGPGIAFLQKPFKRDALLRKLREVLGAAKCKIIDS